MHIHTALITFCKLEQVMPCSQNYQQWEQILPVICMRAYVVDSLHVWNIALGLKQLLFHIRLATQSARTGRAERPEK